MTFTEAAVVVLRLVGRPLHYKKITEIAIAKNLLSHVGKAPDMTMSSRLATMVKKNRDDEPIFKVKPGVFALREFDDEAMALADADFDLDIDSLPDVEAPERPDPEPEPDEGEDAPRRALPGAEVFPEEDDDDEPILAKIEPKREKKEKSRGDDGEDGKGKKRRRRRRRGKGEDDDEPRPRKASREKLDHDRQPDAGDVVGRGLADAVHAVLEAGPRELLTYTQAAELLIQKGRLSGSAAALASTVAAAVRADRFTSAGLPRFREVEGRLGLTAWYLPKEVAKAEREAVGAAKRQREQTHRAFIKKITQLPAGGFAELMASWLNAEGITGLRAVRRPGSSGVELHLAGTWRRGLEEVAVAIVILRDGRDLSPSTLVEVRGSLHHYGNAAAAWVVCCGRVRREARNEVEAAGAPPVVLFDGMSLADAMESRGVGLVPVALPMAGIDHDLLDALRGQPEGLGRDRRDRDGKGRKSKSDRERDRDRDAEAEEAASESDGENGDAEEGKGRRRRRRRRGRGGDDAEAKDTKAQDTKADEESTDDGATAETSEARAEDGMSTDAEAEAADADETVAPDEGAESAGADDESDSTDDAASEDDDGSEEDGPEEPEADDSGDDDSDDDDLDDDDSDDDDSDDDDSDDDGEADDSDRDGEADEADDDDSDGDEPDDDEPDDDDSDGDEPDDDEPEDDEADDSDDEEEPVAPTVRRRRRRSSSDD